MTVISISPTNGQAPQEIHVTTGVYLLLYEQDGELLATGNFGKVDWRSMFASVFQGAVADKLPSFMKR